MGLTAPELIRKPWCIYPWADVGGWHVEPNVFAVDPPHMLYKSDRNANDKYLSHPMPMDGQNPGVSTWWECYYYKTAATILFAICNQQDVRYSSATVRGYGLGIDNAPNQVDLMRMDGAAGPTLGSAAYISDGVFTHIRFSREVSGANRFWRVYINDMVTPVIGPVNDATYTDFAYWGWAVGTTAAGTIVGAEACQS